MARERLLDLGGSARRQLRRFVDLVGPTGGAARQSLVALAFNSVSSFAAGAMLVGFESTWTELAPLLVMVPAAIGLRGNVFATLGNRLSTSIHTGEFRVSFRRDSVLGQNLLASFLLTVVLSVALAGVASMVSSALAIEAALSVWDLTMISVLGGLLASLIVAAATVALSVGAVRFEWDLDNLVAPTVSTLGDVLTIPSLWLMTKLLDTGGWTEVFGAVMWAVSFAALTLAVRSAAGTFRSLIIESLPVLFGALVLSTLAGVVLQNQENFFVALPTIGILLPAFVSSSGALGSMLSGHVATGLHTGLVEPTAIPGAAVRRYGTSLAGLAAPILLLNSLGALAVAEMASTTGPEWWWVVATTAVAGIATLAFVVGVSYYSTIGAWRIGVDPDNFGTPLVTASVDFIGTMALVLTVTAFGLV